MRNEYIRESARVLSIVKKNESEQAEMVWACYEE